MDTFIQCTQHKKNIFDTRIHDILQIVEMLIDTIHKEREHVDQKLKQASAVIDGLQQGVSSQPIDLFAKREHEAMMNQLIEDCYKYICIDSNNLNRADQYNIRTATAESLSSRIRSLLPSTNTINPSIWSSNETLLLLNRLIKTENDLNQLQSKHSLFIEEMMKAENQRDEAIKQERKAQDELKLCEAQLTQVKLELQKKDSEVADWKNIASRRNEISVAPTIQKTFQPTIQSTLQPTIQATALTNTYN